jgi:hypothetical protein
VHNFLVFTYISHTAAIHSTGEQNLTSLDHAKNYKVGDRWAIIIGRFQDMNMEGGTSEDI